MTRVTDLMGEVEQRLAAGRLADAYDATCRALPDARIVVEPTITAQSMHSTPNATANATLQLIVFNLFNKNYYDPGTDITTVSRVLQAGRTVYLRLLYTRR